MANITLVTSFLLQEKDKCNKEKIENYLKRFQFILNLNIPTVLFLDRTLSIEPNEILKVIPFSIEETTMFQTYNNCNTILPKQRTEEKDTVDYMIIQNAKVEFLFLASKIDPYETTHFLWIDFGLSHVIKNNSSFDFLKNFQPKYDCCIGAVLPNIYGNILDQVVWRFAGGVFYVSKNYAEHFFEFHKKIIKTLIPHLIWEVNVFAIMEKCGFQCNTYICDHDDRILTNLE